MTLRRAAVYAAHLPAGSATRRKLGGDQAWSDDMHLLSLIEHGVRVLAWQKTEDAQRKRHFPEPLEPPRPLTEVRAAEEREAVKARKFRERVERRRRARAQQQEDDPSDGR